MSVTNDIANAIQQMEGWFPGSVAYRNNNPGNLRSGVGQTGVDSNGYAIFPDYSVGYAALTNQVNLNIGRGLTLTEFFAGKPGVYAGYAPSADKNNPLQYAAFVGGQTGIPIDIPLNNVAGVQPTSGGSVLDASNNGVTDFSSVSSMGNGTDISSLLAGELSSISIFDNYGNFAPTPIAWIIATGVGLMIVSKLV